MELFFSVVVPVFNVENYIDRCVQSIVNQTFRSYECIFIDDGSTDGSGKILDEYATKYSFVKVIHQENKGVSAARNKGIAECIGRYIVFVDSDDFIELDALEQFYLCAKNLNFPDIIICGYKELHKKYIKEINYYDTDFEIIRKNYLTETWGPSVCNKCFKKFLFDDMLFPEGMLYEDYYLLPKIMYKARDIYVLGKSLYNYDRTVENSISHQIDSKHRYYKWYAKYSAEVFALTNCPSVYQMLEKKTIAEARRCMFKYYSDGLLSETQVDEIKIYLKSKKLSGKDKFWVNRILNDDIFIAKLYAKIKGYC